MSFEEEREIERERERERERENEHIHSCKLDCLLVRLMKYADKCLFVNANLPITFHPCL